MQEEHILEKLEDRIGYHFQDRQLLQQALTHTSYTNERKINKVASYERLEFLGDAVLELISSEALFRQNTELSEGELTKLRAAMVCEPSLAFCARDLDLVPFIRLGKGELYTGGRGRDSISADVMEAVIGAIYLDGGMEQARTFIENFIMADLEDKQLFYDSKSTLQELMQGKLKKGFRYELLEESGPEHHKCFRVQVCMEEEILGEGTGKSKKAAEQQAAYRALLLLRDRGICI
ncbi:MAG: ribonuclease III [Eubacterium sp.]|nr:ribonuclease III [Eubacterium sp.]MCM1216638.1 ribonuclease III [Lachnospiraceae bacterium]MCM1303043.1 ribonuclease III [Butyrivibrio sp.]MCM1344286.1 ribonuclease III [Muribaculaceae bacterium]MCM1239693.1 ribonuclease III [Lachnospiraceae bacterium]